MLKKSYVSKIMIFIMLTLILIPFGSVRTVYAVATDAALYKFATASAYNGYGEEPSKAIDGILGSHWCSTTAAPHWLLVDLGQTQNISRWVVTHAGANGESTSYNTRDFKLQVSDNGTSFTDVDTVTGNTANITDRNVTTSGRYVRLYISTGTQPGSDNYARINSFEIYAVATDAALNKSATASAYNGYGEEPSRAVDGILSSHWCSTTAAPHWLLVDLGQTQNISSWVVKHAGANGESTSYNTRDFKLQVSNNGTSFTDADTVTGNTANITDRDVTTSGRYVRLYITTATQPGSDNYARINSFEIYGSVSTSTPLSANPSGDILRMVASNNATNTHYVYRIFSNTSYVFQSGDYIEYDVKLPPNNLIANNNNVDGAGGIDCITTDNTNLRDQTNWKDQEDLSGHPAANIAIKAYNNWYHRELAVPSTMTGKTAARWDLVGECETSNQTYSAYFDNIVVTDGNGTERKVVFKNASDKNTDGNDNWVSNASGAIYIDSMPLDEPDPRVITTQYATDDIVIAEYVATDAPYNADNTGANDSTTAIQNAINDCYKTGGGTVWLPAGKYKVTSTIYVKPFVTLRGDWRDPDTSGTSYGTVIIANVSSSTNDTPGLFRIGGSAGCMGLTVYYPNQSASNPVPYPYTFEISGSAVEGTINYMMQSVIKCTMLNSYKGICVSMTQPDGSSGSSWVHEMVNITDVKGTVLYIGAEAYNGADVGVWERIKFNNSYWANAPTEFNPPSRTTVDAWTRVNGTGYKFGDLEWEQFIEIECSDYQTGIKIVPGQRISFAGEILFANVLNCNIAVDVTNIDPRWGMSFGRSVLQGNVGNSPISIRNLTTGYVKVTDCTLTGSTSGDNIQISNPGTSPTSYPWKSSLPKPPNTNFYNVTKAPYNADNTGLVGATSAIQAALDDAANAGGGTVFLPAGYYMINTHLTVPANVELRGAAGVPTRDEEGLSVGTVLWAYEGHNTSTPDTATALITLNGNNAGVRGLRVLYPNNNPANGVVPYPYSIRGNGSGVYAINICFVNTYNGIDFKTYQCNSHYIKRVIGCAFRKGIVVGASTEGWIEGCLENATAACRVGYKIPGWVTESNIFAQVIDPHTRPYLQWIVVDGASNEHLLNNFTYGANITFYIMNGTATIFNGGADGMNTNGIGIKVDNGGVNPVTVFNFMKYGGATSSGTVTIYNLLVLG